MSIRLTILCGLIFWCSSTIAGEIVILNEANWEKYAPQGKEVDAIYGDIVLRNDKITSVIAAPKSGRKANMTVGGVGACIIDLTTIKNQNDQLSCFYPGARSCEFTSSKGCTILADGKTYKLEKLPGSSRKITIRFEASKAPEGYKVFNSYSLTDGDEFIVVETKFENTTSTKEYAIRDSMRADRTFTFTRKPSGVFVAEDRWFGQAYGISIDEGQIKPRIQRELQLSYDSKTAQSKNASVLKRKIFPAANSFEINRIVGTDKLTPFTIVDRTNGKAVADARIRLLNSDRQEFGTTDSDGKLDAYTKPGKQKYEISARGRPTVQVDIEAGTKTTVRLESPGVVMVKVTDDSGKMIPCKTEFVGIGETKSPNFGPDSMHTAVGNLTYSMGSFSQLLNPGEYRLVVSHGPEFTIQTKNITVTRGETTDVSFKLKKVVNTEGWISADFHSHSSPSGDNTGDQFGRVQNLLAEHIEYAPCTEHNRIDTYVPHLRKLNAEKLMGTCTGIELTGGPLPVNHQNAFPLVRKPRTQDGGAPRTHVDPVRQIERLALWDNNSKKLLQTNHPNLITIFGDKNNDGTADGGFRKMLPFMDVMEVHPPQTIFDVPKELPKRKSRGNVIFNWMQLLNLGYRIPGVVNTDAHYNFHGSGGLRNYIKCSTDDPSKIDTLEIVRACEKGNVVMSTGPFMKVKLSSGSGASKSTGTAGDDVKISDSKATLEIEVQSAWMEINRVQIFVNGRPDPKLNFRRRDFPKMFGNDVVKFKQEIAIEFKADAHLIVVAIGENEQVGPIMGPSWGKLPPIAVANPIFCDIDRNGFKANGDLLDSPLPGAKELSEEKKKETSK